MPSTHLPLKANSRYAPIRYEATRPFAVRLGKMFWSIAQRGNNARINFISKDLLPLIRLEINKLGRQDGPGPGQAECANIQIFGAFQAGGRVVFDVHRLLTQALSVTDIEDIPCGYLAFPARQLYLHFGPDTGIYDNGMAIEGTFVQYLPDDQSLLFDLVPVGTFAVPYFWRLPMGEQLTGIAVSLKDTGKSISAALEDGVEQIVQNNNAIFEQIAQFEKQLADQYGEPVRVPSPVERIDAKLPVLKKALQLIVNTLFYLSSTEDDVSEDWQPDTPHDLLHQAEHAEKAGTRNAAMNTLVNQGYIKVRYVGKKFADTSAAKAIGKAVSTGKIMPTHLRRGHMRQQPYGPERALRKVIFIPPVVVNPDRADSSPGRVYDVILEKNKH